MRIACILVVVALSAMPAGAQSQPSVTPIETSLCEMVTHSANYSGKLVRFKGEFGGNWEGVYVGDRDCNAHAWVEGPNGKGVLTESVDYKGGPLPNLPPEEKSARDFDNLEELDASGNLRFILHGTFTGYFFAEPDIPAGRRRLQGFGPDGVQFAFVIYSVEHVTREEAPYSAHIELIPSAPLPTALDLTPEPSDKQPDARVRAEFLHAWNGYKKYAWGHDELKPLSKGYHDWYGTSFYMTPVDALDTMMLMGMDDEAKSTRDYIATHLSFDKDVYVKNFEFTIRLLGGLLSSYEMSHDKRLLVLAQDLGDRLLPVFNSKTGMPYMYVNLKTGATKGVESNPAEIGTLIIEFGTLSKLTGKPVYFDKAKRALIALYDRRSPIGLVGSTINVDTGEWTNTESHISGGIDSYYEYLLKCSVLFGDKDCKRMWETSLTALNKYVADDAPTGLWYGTVDMNTGKRLSTTYGALDAFFPAVLALGGDFDRARRLEDSAYKMWTANGIEPEVIDYSSMSVAYDGYALRPEIIESAYYLYHYTHDPKYLAMGRTYFDTILKYCRTDDGYAALKSVKTKEQADSMESFFLAETLKYSYLLFAPEKTLDFNKVVLNTEAHPMRRK